MKTQHWTRRQWLQGAGMTLAVSALHAQNRSGSFHQIVAEGERRADGTVQFPGIPYAQPPVGPLRFRPPAAVTPGKPSLGRFAASAMQTGRKDVSEDCLYLNIYAPSPKTQPYGPFPVYVWVHGGGFTGGSPNDTDGSVFAKQGIIVVTVAYRLGVFGFLDWSPLLGPGYADSANNGLRDVIAALKWVRENIRGFGGDPSRVTIGGQSAGAKMVDTLMGVEEAKPLFAQMISESGGAERIRDAGSIADVSKTFAEQFHRIAGATADPRTADAATLIQSQLALVDAWPGNFPLRAESGGKLLPRRAIAPIASGNTKGKRLLIGTNRDESAAFLGEHAPEAVTQRRLGNIPLSQFNERLAKYAALYPQMNDRDLHIRAVTAEEYWLPSIHVAEAHAKGGGSTWFYRLDEVATTGSNRGTAYHAYDLGFVWDRLAAGETPSAHALGHQMHDAWAAFIKGGEPAATALPKWPQWNPTTRPTMIFKDQSAVEQQPFEAELRLWDGFRFD